MEDSILTSIKKMLGIEQDYTHFDADIIMHINSVFMILTQLGVGPEEGFYIEDEMTIWDDYIEDRKTLQLVKSYMYFRVKLLFDSTTLPSAVITSINEQIREFEWRLSVAAENVDRSE
jgi:hypothetical protein